MSLRVASSVALRLRYASVVALLLFAPFAGAQCNLNGAWTGTYSGTKVQNGVSTPDAGSISMTIFNSTATSFNANGTTTKSSGGTDTQSFVGMVNGASVTITGGDSGGSATINLTVSSNCNSMSGNFNTIDFGDPNNPPKTSSGTVSITRSGATLSLGDITFQTAVIGSSTPAQQLGLNNSGSSPLSLGTPTVTGDFSILPVGASGTVVPNERPHAATTTCTTSLPPGATCTVAVACNPTGPGVRTGTLFINDQNKTPLSSTPLTCSGVNPVAGASFVPESGWWWDSSLNGTGFFIEYGGNSGQGLFVGGFLYDANGNSAWLVSTGPLTSAKYTSTWIKTAGGQTLTGAYKAPSQTIVANIGLTFTDATHAVLTRPDGSQINLTRFSFSATQTRTPPVGGAPQSGWWWAGQSFSGTGYGIEIQGSAVFVVAYVYDNNGGPVWYLATGAMNSPNNYTGQWDLYAGGPQLTSPEGNYSAHTVAGSSVPMALSFTDGANGTLTMGSVTIPITRFQTY